MLEQEEADNNGGSNGTTFLNNGGGGGVENGDVSENATTTTTTVRIHTTYKKRAAKFMNRPNVQNGLGANSFLNPYGGGSGGIISGGANRLVTNNQYPNQTSNNSGPGGTRVHHHRPVITRNSIFGGGGGAGGGGGGTSTFYNSTPVATSPQGTITSTTTASTTVESRPPFVTTVTRGRFLPSKFDLMVEKSLFTFSSRPKPVGLIARHQCSLSGGPIKENDGQDSQPRGAHDYFNVMWDPHIYRGTTTTLTSSLKQPDIESKIEGRFRKRRDLGNATSTSSSNAFNSISPTTMSNRNRYRMTTKVTSRSRTFPPPQYLEGRHQVHVQTEEYLEDFTRDVSRGEVDAIVQTDPIEDELIPLVSELRSEGGKRRLILPEKLGIDASTQVLPGELVSFDEQVQPIVEAVVGKILEQALLETMEEEEIGALKAQQNRFLEKRKEEERELKKLQEQQERISAEKERLRRHLERQLQQHAENGDAEAIALLESSSQPGSSLRQNGNNNDAAAYLLELLPSVINSLRQEGLLTEQYGDDVLSSVVPLWSSSSKTERGSLDLDEDDESNPFPDGYRSRMNTYDEVSLKQEVADVQTSEDYVEDDVGGENESDPAPEVTEDVENDKEDEVATEDAQETEDGKTEENEEQQSAEEGSKTEENEEEHLGLADDEIATEQEEASDERVGETKKEAEQGEEDVNSDEKEKDEEEEMEDGEEEDDGAVWIGDEETKSEIEELNVGEDDDTDKDEENSDAEENTGDDDNVSKSRSSSAKAKDDSNDIPVNDSVVPEEQASSEQLPGSEDTPSLPSSSSQLPNGAIPSVEMRQGDER